MQSTCVTLEIFFSFQAGLRILHIDQANYDLNEVAYFDVNEEERADFSGSWSNYPYLPSGMVVWTGNPWLTFVKFSIY